MWREERSEKIITVCALVGQCRLGHNVRIILLGHIVSMETQHLLASHSHTKYSQLKLDIIRGSVKSSHNFLDWSRWMYKDSSKETKFPTPSCRLNFRLSLESGLCSSPRGDGWTCERPVMSDVNSKFNLCIATGCRKRQKMI